MGFWSLFCPRSCVKCQSLPWLFLTYRYLISLFCWFQYLPFDPYGYQKARKKAERGIQFALNQIELHRQEINYDNPARDFIDSYLLKQRECKDEPDTVFNGEYLLKERIFHKLGYRLYSLYSRNFLTDNCKCTYMFMYIHSSVCCTLVHLPKAKYHPVKYM